MSVVEILTKAKEILIERGVNRDGGFVNAETGCSVCALGAVKLAAGGEVKDYNEGEGDPDFDITLAPGVGWLEYSHAQRVLNSALPRPDDWVPRFNDRSTDDQQVIDLFDRAIELAKD